MLFVPPHTCLDLALHLKAANDTIVSRRRETETSLNRAQCLNMGAFADELSRGLGMFWRRLSRLPLRSPEPLRQAPEPALDPMCDYGFWSCHSALYIEARGCISVGLRPKTSTTTTVCHKFLLQLVVSIALFTC